MCLSEVTAKGGAGCEISVSEVCVIKFICQRSESVRKRWRIHKIICLCHWVDNPFREYWRRHKWMREYHQSFQLFCIYYNSFIPERIENERIWTIPSPLIKKKWTGNHGPPFFVDSLTWERILNTDGKSLAILRVFLFYTFYINLKIAFTVNKSW